MPAPAEAAAAAACSAPLFILFTTHCSTSRNRLDLLYSVFCNLEMTVTIKIFRIVDGNKVDVPNEIPPYEDGSNRDVVKADLVEFYGKGILVRNGNSITDEHLSPGEYEYKLITQPSSQPQGK